MGEIKTNDLQEIKKTAAENYQNVKPEDGMTVPEARKTWDSVFKSDIDDKRSESPENNKAERTEEGCYENHDQQNDSGETQDVKSELKNQGDVGRTKEEIVLLEKLSAGKLDGDVGKVYYTTGGSSIWTEIRNGIPVRYKEGPGGKYFDGKETVRYEGRVHILEKWETDDEKIAFLQKYGWLIEDEDAMKYSAKFKPEYKPEN